MLIPLDVPPGINSDDTTFAASPAWSDGSHMRFVEGRAQTTGGWERVTLSSLPGVCRTVFSWTDNSNVQTLAFGQHNKLHVWQGGTLADVTPAAGFTAGAIDGAGSAGYGTGSYGGGNYGAPSATDYFPLTWSLAAYGQKLLACPRNQTIFEWSNDTTVVAAAVTNAPAKVTYMTVSPTRQVFALGCSQEVGGVFNPTCIRHSSIGDETAWTTDLTTATTAREYVLPGGGRIVAGRWVGRNLLIWTNYGLWLGSYNGQIQQVWKFDKVSDKCGLIGPNAAVVVGSTAYWISPDRQFHFYPLGGAVQTLPCTIRKDFADNLAASQGDKIVASSTSEFNEVRWDYPDGRDGYENSRYIAVCVDGPDAGVWHKGKLFMNGATPVRTARVDAGPSQYPCGVTYGGAIYWEEKSHAADGGTLSWFIETADMYLDENLSTLVRKFWPDINSDQLGAVYLTITTRMFPQGTETVFGPYTSPPGTTELDTMATGRLGKLTLYGNSAPAYARIGRPSLDVVQRGRR